MQKSIYFLLFLMTLNLNAQNTDDQDSTSFFDNVQFGGGFNMAFGRSYSAFSIAPSAIYNFSPVFSAGVSLKYMYHKTKSYTQSTINVYGGSIISLYKPLPKLQFSTEFECLKLSKQQIFQEVTSPWQSALFLGVEYVTGNIAMGLRYDVLYEKTSLLYPSPLSPVFRIYF